MSCNDDHKGLLRLYDEVFSSKQTEVSCRCRSETRKYVIEGADKGQMISMRGLQ